MPGRTFRGLVVTGLLLAAAGQVAAQSGGAPSDSSQYDLMVVVNEWRKPMLDRKRPVKAHWRFRVMTSHAAAAA